MAESKVLDTVRVSETFEAKNGSKKTREYIIRSMENSGSQFVNLHVGRGSANISKSMIDKVVKGLQTVSFETKNQPEIDREEFKQFQKWKKSQGKK